MTGARRRRRLFVSPMRSAIAAWVVFFSLLGGTVQAKVPVSIELVLAVDTSASVDGFEYGLLMNGMANAFRTDEIIDLIGQHDGVAVTLIQWSSDVDERFMIPWHLLTDRASVLAFADRVAAAERDPDRRFTGIGEAIDFGVRLIADNGFDGHQLKIDVSGDGRNNVGLPLSISRQRANALGIVINGLPILTHIVDYSLRKPMRANVDYYGLESYYREEIIHGPGAFIEIADDYDDFARAFLRKLKREIAPAISREESAPGDVQKAQAGPRKAR